MNRLLTLGVDYPKTMVLCFTVLTLFGAYYATDIKIEPDGLNLLDASHPARVESRRIAEQLGTDDALFISISPRYTAPNKSTDSPDFDTLLFTMSVTNAASQIEGVDQHRLLSVTSLAPGHNSSVRADITSLAALSMMKGLLVGFDGRSTGIIVPLLQTANEATINDLESLLANFQDKSSYRVTLTGHRLGQLRLGSQIFWQLVFVIPLTGLLMVVILSLWFRSLTMALVSLLGALASIVWVFGLMASMGAPISIVTLIIPVLLLSTGICDELHLANEVRWIRSQSLKPTLQATIQKAVLNKSRPMILTSITTSAALAPMSLSSVHSLQVVGTFAPIGVLLSLAISLSVTPAIWALMSLPTSTNASRKPLISVELVLLKLRKLTSGKGTFVLVFVVSVTTLGAHKFGQLQVNDSWLSNFSRDTSLVRSETETAINFGTSTRLILMLNSGEASTWYEPSQLDLLTSIDAAITTHPKIATSLSFPTLVSTLKAMSSDDSLTPYTIRYAIATTTGYHLTNSLITPAGDEAAIHIFAGTPDYRELDQVISHINAQMSANFASVSFSISGGGVVSHVLVNQVVTDQLHSFVGAICISFALVAFFLRSIRLAWFAILPSALAIAILSVAMVITSTSLGIATSMAGAIVLGVGIDYSVHFAYRQKLLLGQSSTEVAPFDVAAASVGVDAAVVSIAMGGMWWLSNPALAILGAIISFGLVVAATITIFIWHSETGSGPRHVDLVLPRVQ